MSIFEQRPSSATAGGQVSTQSNAISTTVVEVLSDGTYDAGGQDDSYVTIPRSDLRQGTTSSPTSSYSDSDIRLSLSFSQPTPYSNARLFKIEYWVRGRRVGGAGKPDADSRLLRISREDGRTYRSTFKGTEFKPRVIGTHFTTTLPDSPKLVLRGGEYSAGKDSTDKDQKKFETRARDLRISEVGYTFYYVDQPEVTTVSAPVDGSTLTSASAPQIQWRSKFDEVKSGNDTQYWQVKLFKTPAGGWSGFNATTNTADLLESASGTGNPQLWQPTVNLTNGTYRAYVQIGTAVKGYFVPLYSDWNYSGFTVTVDRPGVPTSFSATADNANGRIALSATKVAATAGPPVVTATDYIQFQRSTDSGTTWEDIRTDNGDGRVTAASGATTYYDYEVGNGVNAIYRCRAVDTYAADTGNSYSAWSSSTSAVNWTSTDWWLKNPLLPSQNVVVNVHSLTEESRAARQGVFQAIGSTTAVVVSDTRGPRAGDITLRVDSDEEKADLDTLVESTTPLLLQGAPDEHWSDTYLVLGNYSRTRAYDKAFAETTFDSTSWIEVESPADDIGE